MSIESAKAFVERMKDDEEFRNKVNACKTPEDRMKLVKDEGYDFSKADIKVVTAIIDDSSLEQAAGGMQARMSSPATAMVCGWFALDIK